MKKGTIIFSIILVALSSYFFYLAFDFVKLPGQTDIGPAAFPQMICAVLIILGVFVGIKQWRAEDEKVSYFGKKMAVAVALFIAFLLMFRPLGVVVSGIFLEFVITLMLCTEDRKRALPKIAIVSVVCPILIYIIFARFLKVPLPMGILENIL